MDLQWSLLYYGILGLAAFVLVNVCLILSKQRKTDYRDIDDSILKNGASAKKLQGVGEVDYIIVGSGLAGMTSAALLAKVGFKVLILEQHDIAGGATHSFETEGFEWDVGLHYIGERMTSALSPARRMFDVITDGSLEWCEMADAYDYGPCPCHPNCDNESLPSRSLPNKLECAHNCAMHRCRCE